MTYSNNGWLATTDPVEAYNGLRIPEPLIYHIADQVRSGLLPIVGNHDITQPINLRYTLVEVRRHPSGSLGVYVEFESDDPSFDISQYGGFSIAFVGNPSPPDTSSGKPPISFYADAIHFDESTYEQAVEELLLYFSVGTGIYYQYSAIVPAVVIIEFALHVLQDMPAALIAGALFEVVKNRFLKRGETDEETVVRLRVKGPDTTFKAQVKTKNPEVLRQAFEGFQALALAEHRDELHVFDERSAKWKAVDDSGSPEIAS